MKLLQTTILISMLILGVHLQACSNGCFECSPQTNKCRACIQNFSLTIMGECVKNSIANCNLYLNSTYCIRCSSTYFAFNNTCVKDFSGCFKNMTKSKCSICSPELSLVNGTCSGVFNCRRYNSDSRCVQCDKGFTLSGNICVANTDNCQVVSKQNGVCTQCQANYKLMGYRCMSIVYYSPNCELYDQMGCSICKDGYTLFEGNCYGRSQIQLIKTFNQQQTTINNATINTSPSIQPKTTNDLAKMTVSNINISIFNQTNPSGVIKLSDSSENKSLAQIPYCKFYEGGYCIECYSNFHISSGVCRANNPLCKQIYPNGSCKSCYKGYSLEAQTCILPPVNVTKNLELINEVNAGLQQNLDPHCIIYNKSKCLQCGAGYYISTNGSCLKIKANCLLYNLTNGDCFVCISPYALINNDCIYPIANCLLYNNKNECYQCSQGFYIHENACTPNDVTCASYDLIGRCTKCVETYYLVNNVCVYPALGYDAYCISYVNSYCSSCLIGYFLQNYRCQKIDSQCLKFDYENRVCLVCGSGLSVNGPYCI